MEAARFCNDCAFGCRDRCQRVTPGVHTRWAAFEMSGEAAQHERGPKRNCAYVAWIGAEWRAWKVLNGRPAGSFASDEDHAAFDAWLTARHSVPTEAREAA